jgi:hypothetical protein
MATKEETAAKLAAAKDSLDQAQAAHDQAELESAGPRDPRMIVFDLFAAIVMRLGNRPELELLVQELEGSLDYPLRPDGPNEPTWGDPQAGEKAKPAS